MNKKIKLVLDFFKNYWLGLIFIILTIFIVLKVGILKTFWVTIYGWSILIYIVMKNNMANMIVRRILKMTEAENEQKAKRKSNHYGKQAQKESFKVKKFNSNK